LRWKSIFSISLLILGFGALVPVVEQIIPPRYTEKTLQTRLETALLLENGEIVREFLDNGGGVQQGKALYPRYYAAGEGEEDQAADDRLRQFGNLNFSLAGPSSQKILLPLTEKQQIVLPHYSDVLVFGCGENALAIFVEIENYILLRDPLPEELVCPISHP
jgi:hypothetical protein